MEFEFDKEIDALLRKAGKSGEATAPVFDSHLDADEISMFAENATPEAARSRMISHFADCDRCRTVLSNVVALNSEDPAEVQSAAPVAMEIEDEKTSWLNSLFKPRNLAFGFGALALIFVGFIGFGVIRNMSPGETQLAQADKKEVSQAAAETADMAVDTDSSNSALGSSNSEDPNAAGLTDDSAIASEAPLALAKNEAVTGKDVARRQELDKDGFSGSRSDLGRFRASRDKKPAEEERDAMSDRVAATETAPVSKPAPPPAPAANKSILTKRGGVEKNKEDRNAELAANEAAPDSTVAAGAAEGKKRQISGKTFDRRNGVWYDSAYRNQPTTSIKRGTANYRSLDSGVRSIAEQLSGTVVVIWKTKAYKIQ